MRYLVCAALLALLAVTGCDRGTGASSVSSGSATPAPLTITTASIPGFVMPAATGSPMPAYTATISATGGTGTYSWSIVAGTLPAGLSIAPTGTPATTISGTMTSPATTSFTVQVTDSAAATATRAYTLVVTAAPATLTITTTTIPDFTVPGWPGATMPSYSATISATGGTGTYSWSIVAGTLPAGLSIAPTGTPDTTITGTMTSPATTSFTVQVTDSAFTTATMAYTLVVNYAPTPPPGSTTPVYFGQPLAGRMLFICDMSAATAGQPLANLQTELTAALNSLTGSEEFDILVYNEAISGFVSALWGAPQQATAGNVTAAVNWVNGPSFTAAGGVDYACYKALQTSFTNYTNVDTAFLYTWGTPGDGSAILMDYPGWAASDPNRQLTVICKGGSAPTFAQQLAALAGGTYVP